ncbi:MAG: hypothetical protein DHS20C07_22860 [Methyloligella sp.]|nr:MAG: hypothetical protein DHS20C07_22860 [Methyloligella sp.]
MPIISPFISFQGRITRRTFWVGLLVLVFASPFAFSTIISADPFGELVQTAQKLGLVGLIWSIVLIFSLAALLTKRLHDRNKTGLYAFLFYGPALLKAVQFYTGLEFGVSGFGGGALSWLQDWGWLIGLELGAVGIWFLIELGLYGPVDPNKYGPDPRDD